jgi:hypothetical protein
VAHFKKTRQEKRRGELIVTMRHDNCLVPGKRQKVIKATKSISGNRHFVRIRSYKIIKDEQKDRPLIWHKLCNISCGKGLLRELQSTLIITFN